MIFYDLFLVRIKISYYLLLDKNYYRMQKIDIIVVVKKKLLNIILLIKKFWEKMQKIYIETCQTNKKKQKENMGQIGIEKWQKIKKQTKRISKKLSGVKKKNFFVEYKNEWQDIKIWWCWS